MSLWDLLQSTTSWYAVHLAPNRGRKSRIVLHVTECVQGINYMGTCGLHGVQKIDCQEFPCIPASPPQIVITVDCIALPSQPHVMLKLRVCHASGLPTNPRWCDSRGAEADPPACCVELTINGRYAFELWPLKMTQTFGICIYSFDGCKA